MKIKNKCKHLPNLEEGAGFDLPEPRLYLEGRMKGQGGGVESKMEEDDEEDKDVMDKHEQIQKFCLKNANLELPYNQ